MEEFLENFVKIRGVWSRKTNIEVIVSKKEFDCRDLFVGLEFLGQLIEKGFGVFPDTQKDPEIAVAELRGVDEKLVGMDEF
jgi:hypothetical protein